MTSVILSGDGSKVAFVENTSVGAVLRILKWKAGEGTSATSPSNVGQDISGSPWTNCPGATSCIESIALNGGAADTNSSPFYNYGYDIMYIGDDNGVLHKFTGVFDGAPTEVTAGGWPITVDSGAILTSPVYDSVSGNIFVGDSNGFLSYVLETGSTTGACASGSIPCLGTPSQLVNILNNPLTVGGVAFSPTITDAPIVDGVEGTVLAFSNNDSSKNSGAVFQTNTALTTLASFSLGGTGAAALPSALPIYAGAFDNAYLTSTIPTLVGHMYVCGRDPGDTDKPAYIPTQLRCHHWIPDRRGYSSHFHSGAFERSLLSCNRDVQCQCVPRQRLDFLQRGRPRNKRKPHPQHRWLPRLGPRLPLIPGRNKRRVGARVHVPHQRRADPVHRVRHGPLRPRL